MTITEEPRAWVGCLACYDNGTLVGDWVDGIDAADVTLDDIHGGEICPNDGEEMWVMDLDNYPAQCGEMSPKEAATIAESIVAAQKALGDLYPIFEVWASDNDGASVEDFNDNYQGEFDSVEDFARAIAEDTGTYFNDETWPLYCIDWATAARDLMYDYQEIRVAGMSHIVRNL